MMRLSHKSKTNTGKIWRIECLNKFEEWKDCVDYEGLYQVSNLGNVRSLDKYVWNRFQYVKRPGRIMKTHIDRYGYVRVVLRKDGKGVNEQVHRLVALAFINNPQQLPQVNHKDTNKQNNFAGTRENDYKDGNLEWCTNKENMKHAFNNIDFNYETIPVLQIDLRKQIVLAKYNSIQDAARSVDDNATNILRSCRFNNDSAKGYRWLIDDGLYQIGDYVDLPKLYHPSTKKRKVVQVKDGVIVNIYNSISDAAKYNNCLDSAISMCCKGKIHQHHNYVWCYYQSGMEIGQTINIYKL